MNAHQPQVQAVVVVTPVFLRVFIFVVGGDVVAGGVGSGEVTVVAVGGGGRGGFIAGFDCNSGFQQVLAVVQELYALSWGIATACGVGGVGLRWSFRVIVVAVGLGLRIGDGGDGVGE